MTAAVRGAPGRLVNNGERCDRCPARAKHRYSKQGMVLDFCGHHSEIHGPALDAAGWRVTVWEDPK